MQVFIRWFLPQLLHPLSHPTLDTQKKKEFEEAVSNNMLPMLLTDREMSAD